MDDVERYDRKGRRSVFTGGLILIALGILIMLAKLGLWSFSQSWPVLLLVIALGTLIQRVKDLGGWIIGGVGLVFLIAENLEAEIYTIVTFSLPVLLILLGIHVLTKHFRKKEDDPDQ